MTLTPFTILLIGGGLILLLIIIGIVVSITSERSLVDERLGKYMEDEEAKQQDEQKQPATSIVTDWLNNRVEASSFGDRVARDLARADIKFRVGEYFALVVGAVIGLAIVAFLVGGRHPLSFLIGGVIGFFLPPAYVRREQARRLQRFNDQLGDMLNLMVNGLRAGYSTMQALEAVSRELPPPISDEFRRVVQEMQLGVPMERSLDNLLRRIPSEDLDFVVTAVNVQREVGGPLAEILDTISFTIRERVRIKGEIRVLTAQVMTSGKLLSGVPFALALMLWFINQEYMMEFVKPDNIVCGGIAIGLGLIMIVVGYFVMTRIADIEV
jgi:tight adherence protein B